MKKVLESELPQLARWAQRTGASAGGALPVQSTSSRPAFVSWSLTVPELVTASGGLSSPSVVHASVNMLPALLFTVNFSLVGVGEYELSFHSYVQVASVEC